MRLFLAYATTHKLVLYQIDVKGAFLYGGIQKVVYVTQPPEFEYTFIPEYDYKLLNALYELKQAPRAWYEKLSSFLFSNQFQKGQADKTLFLKKEGKDLLLV